MPATTLVPPSDPSSILVRVPLPQPVAQNAPKSAPAKQKPQPSPFRAVKGPTAMILPHSPEIEDGGGGGGGVEQMGRKGAKRRFGNDEYEHDEQEHKEYRPGQTTEDGGNFEPEKEPDSDGYGEFIKNHFLDNYGESYEESPIMPHHVFLLDDGTPVVMGPYGGSRYEDHRSVIPTSKAMKRWGWPQEIVKQYEESTRTPALMELLRRSGAMRIHVDSDGDHIIIHHGTKPTRKQLAKISYFVRGRQPSTVIIANTDDHEKELHSPKYWEVEEALEKSGKKLGRKNKLSRRGRKKKLARVEANDVHPDYQPTGIAPRIGHALSRIAAEGDGRGEPAHASIAEAILRTGDHSILPILADALDESNHSLANEFDWRHAPRAIEIDRALHHTIRSLRPVRHYDGTRQPITAGWILSDWQDGARTRLGKRGAINAARRAVSDVNIGDIVHSLVRLMSLTGGRQHEEPIPAWQSAHEKTIMQRLGALESDPHRYPDTRITKTLRRKKKDKPEQMRRKGKPKRFTRLPNADIIGPMADKSWEAHESGEHQVSGEILQMISDEVRDNGLENTADHIKHVGEGIASGNGGRILQSYSFPYGDEYKITHELRNYPFTLSSKTPVNTLVRVTHVQIPNPSGGTRVMALASYHDKNSPDFDAHIKAAEETKRELARNNSPEKMARKGKPRKFAASRQDLAAFARTIKNAIMGHGLGEAVMPTKALSDFLRDHDHHAIADHIAEVANRIVKYRGKDFPDYGGASITYFPDRHSRVLTNLLKSGPFSIASTAIPFENGSVVFATEHPSQFHHDLIRDRVDRQKDADRINGEEKLPVMMAKFRSPAGGMVVRGQFYPGGKMLPKEATEAHPEPAKKKKKKKKKLMA